MIDRHTLTKLPTGQHLIANYHGTPGLHKTPQTWEVRTITANALTELIEALPPDWTTEEKSNTLTSLGILQSDLDNLHEDPHYMGDMDKLYQIELIGYFCYYVITNRAAITNEAIITADEAELPQWRDHYQNTTREQFDTFIERELHHAQTDATGTAKYDDQAWTKPRATFERHASFLWQVKRRLGEL